MTKNNDLPAQPTLEFLRGEARAMLETIVRQLSDSAKEITPGKFFPNGIELIYLKLEAGLTTETKAVVEVKIAGEKGIGLLSDSQTAPQSDAGSA